VRLRETKQKAWKPVTEIGNLNVTARRKVMPKLPILMKNL